MFRAALTTIGGATALAAVLALSAPPVAGLEGVAAHAATCRYADGKAGEITRRQARDAIVCLINGRRDARGKRRLDAHHALHKAAGRHSRRMERSGCRSHRCPGERDLAGRVSATSYLPCSCSWGVGENIAWGSGERGTPRRIVKGWMGSAGHRANLLDGDFRHFGVGVASNGDDAIYTAVFGYRR
ncbi:MAG: CAP domain-containing protein [Solirubrobacterales bacterium]